MFIKSESGIFFITSVMFSGLRDIYIYIYALGKQFVGKSILDKKRIGRGERGDGRKLKVQCGLQQVIRAKSEVRKGFGTWGTGSSRDGGVPVGQNSFTGGNLAGWGSPEESPALPGFVLCCPGAVPGVSPRAGIDGAATPESPCCSQPGVAAAPGQNGGRISFSCENE